LIFAVRREQAAAVEPAFRARSEECWEIGEVDGDSIWIVV
jgi:hypothetical protein